MNIAITKEESANVAKGLLDVYTEQKLAGSTFKKFKRSRALRNYLSTIPANHQTLAYYYLGAQGDKLKLCKAREDITADTLVELEGYAKEMLDVPELKIHVAKQPKTRKPRASKPGVLSSRATRKVTVLKALLMLEASGDYPCKDTLATEISKLENYRKYLEKSVDA